MKVHTTNYFNTFIMVAEDTKAVRGTIPPNKGKTTIAEMQYKLIAESPYKFTSDDVLFQVFADRNDFTKAEYKKQRELFFSKEQTCFRSSPLPKNYGFGIHHDSKGKIALFGMETKEYRAFVADKKISKLKAMKSTK